MTVPPVTPASRLANARDLASVGHGVRPGVVYRADAPSPGDEAPSHLEDWPPRTVVDLRGDSEKAHAHALGAVATIVDIPVLDDAALTGAQARETLMSLEVLYTHMTQGAPAAALVRAVHLVAEAEGPVLVHCSAGKDRTGVLAALLETLLDVPRAAVVADYVATGEHMHGVIERMMRGVTADFREAAMAQMPPEVFEAPAHAIEVVLDRWEAEGGAGAWFATHGGEADAVARLRARLLLS
ncbi:tyrosine-protein phosphatase [Demequina sp. NBRC 110051]|uniref:tyrosine-protein phosphatase n=1 Tax=Demequina sp. NBRC 110051 TaxID=1570340 RepID=UPI00117C671D|nr:tyrosine-protein phosphatase [Demequina sp. NBRC 110051]